MIKLQKQDSIQKECRSLFVTIDKHQTNDVKYKLISKVNDARFHTFTKARSQVTLKRSLC